MIESRRKIWHQQEVCLASTLPAGKDIRQHVLPIVRSHSVPICLRLLIFLYLYRSLLILLVFDKFLVTLIYISYIQSIALH